MRGMKAPIMNQATRDPEILRFAYGETTLGTILLAESAKGVVALSFGESRPGLLRELEQSFPKANFLFDQVGLDQTVKTAVSLVDVPHLRAKLVLDMRGSSMEVAVWQALEDIPVGETRSYGELAKRLPIPATAQDVSAACAANRIAVAIPCHRVVKSDGSISGYRWGVQRKRCLINKEVAW
jgi:AraC family transcriptional regulator, regulatory protein of adaptative response / methylated-DNA-[protein]-cysteine methyltransferase